MFKVVYSSAKAILPSHARARGGLQSRSCQICGNGFLALSPRARTCEFCKTPFSSILSGATASALRNAAVG
jgi:hypothetical protein